MRHWGLCCVLAGSLAGVIGCGWQGSASSAKGGLAVVDLDEIAKAVGVSARLDDMLKMKKVSLNNALVKADTELTEGLKTLIEEVKAEHPEQVPAEEARKIQKESATANAKRQMMQNQAQAELAKFENQLKVQFRAVVRPVAQEIAAKKGFSIVIPKNDALLLSVEPGSDITNDVILALQTRKTSTEVKPAPATEAAPPAETKPTADAEQTKPKKKSDEKKTAEAKKSKEIE